MALQSDHRRSVSGQRLSRNEGQMMVFAGDRVALKDPLPCKSQPDLHPAASVNRCGSSWEKTYGGNGAACLAQHRR